MKYIEIESLIENILLNFRVSCASLSVYSGYGVTIYGEAVGSGQIGPDISGTFPVQIWKQLGNLQIGPPKFV